MPPLTDEQKEESNKRVQSFKEEMFKLSEKYNVDLFNYPQYVPSKDGSFRLTILTEFLDKTYLGVPSVMSDEIIKK